MSIFTSDTFTDTPGTLLENHTGETGATWTKHPNFTSGSAAIDDTNRLRGNAADNDVYYASATPAGGSADYDIDFDITPIGGTLSVGVTGRMSISAVTYYLFDYENSGNFKLYTVVNGSTLNTTTFAQALTNGTTYHCRLSLRGSTISCYFNGTAIITKTDTNISAAGHVGVFFATNDVNGTSGLRLDNFQAATPNTVSVTDANVFFSPYNWYSDGNGTMGANNIKASSTYALSNTPGGYLKITVNAVTAGTATLLLDTTPLNGITAGNCPELSYSIDGQAFTTQLLAYATGTTRLSLSNNLSAGNHTFIFYFRSVTLSGSSAMGDRWTTPASCVKITGIELDGRGSATTTQTLHSKRMLVYGDSITEGADAVGSSNANADQDSTQVYAQLLAIALDAEVGIVGFSAQGWTVSGYGNVPKFYDTGTPANSSFDHYFSGASRLVSGSLSPVPDYILVLHGTNDAAQSAVDADVTSAVAGWLPGIRADAHSAAIFLTIPFAGGKRSAITAGCNAVSDPNAHLIDLGTAIQPTLSSGGVNTNDALHPNVRGHATFSALLANQIRQIVGANSFIASTGEFVGGSVALSAGAFSAQ